MKITEYIKALLPSFDRGNILESIEETRVFIDETIIPWSQVLNSIHKPKGSKEFKDANLAFNSFFPQLKSKPFFQAKGLIFKNVSDNLSYLANQSTKLFGAKVTKESITYKKAAILQLLDIAAFSSEYFIKQANYLIEAETTRKFKERFIPPQLEYLKKNERTYLEGLVRLNVNKRDFIKLIDNIPDLAINEDESTTQAVVGFKAIDPFKLGFINQRLNPFYHWRIFLAEVKVKRHQERKALKQMLEMRILALKEEQSGNQDPRLEEQINYISGRVQTLEYEINKFEEKYG